MYIRKKADSSFQPWEKERCVYVADDNDDGNDSDDCIMEFFKMKLFMWDFYSIVFGFKFDMFFNLYDWREFLKNDLRGATVALEN